ncbi:MAG: protein phosphatase 2C domain-containing protein [Saccharofermentans sp.]|nr:protein phosphatase 2C domain-containing protein [Saccharofermentans sp.]
MIDFAEIPSNILSASILGGLFFLVSLVFFGYVIYGHFIKYKKVDLNYDALTPDVAYFHEKGKRDYQEDSLYISELDDYKKSGIVACVSDGMGGLDFGDEVSEYVVDCISKMFPLSFFAVDENATNIRRISESISNTYHQKAGATLAMVNILNNYMTFYSVGDSNVMLVRKGETTILNQKQNYVSLLIANLVKAGKPTLAAYGNPRARALTDFMGNTVSRVLYPSKPIRLYDGDTIIVCSDGVTDVVTEKYISQHCSNVSAANTASNLKLMVRNRKNPKQDNYTAIVIKLGRPIV